MNKTDLTDLHNRDLAIQEARAELRLSFLDALSALKGREAEFRLQEGSAVTGRLTACDRDSLLLHVAELRTPLAQYSHATLRTGDLVSIRVRLPAAANQH